MLAVVACVLAMVCKRMRQLPTLLAYVGSCCVRVGNGVQTGATTANIVGVCWQLLRACWQWCANGRNNCQHCWRMLAVVACVLAMMCKRAQQLPTSLAYVGSCCVRVGNGVQTDATTANIVGVCWQLLRACWQWCANGRNNCQHCWRMLAVVACVLAMMCKRAQQLPTLLAYVGSCCVRVGNGVQTGATTANIVGVCWQLLRACWQWCANGCDNCQHCWRVLAVVACVLAMMCKRAQQLPTSLAYVGSCCVRVDNGVQTDATTANIVGVCWQLLRACWQWCANGRNNCQHCWRMLAVVACVLAMVCKRMRQLPTLLAYVGSCCVRVGNGVQTGATTANIVGVCWQLLRACWQWCANGRNNCQHCWRMLAVVACVLAMMCKRAQQLPTLLAYVGSCCVRVGNGVQTGATTANIVGVCWQLLRACWQWCANGRNNCQHCWRMLAVVACVLAMVCKRMRQLPTLLAYVGSCCVRVGNGVQTGATTANIVGVCWQLLRACWQWCANGRNNCQHCWRMLAVVACVLAMVCKRMRQLPTLLAYVGSCCVRVGNGVQTGATTANIVGVCWQLLRACWQWCANGRNNCQHCWRMLAVVACVLAMVCKRMRQLPTLLAYVGSCCVRVGNGVQTGATTANIVGVCWQLLRACWQWCANGCDNCQHCWRMLAVVACVLAMVCKRAQQLPTLLAYVGSCCVRVGNGVQTDATTANIVGVCWQLLRACWQWCANGRNNCQHCWRMLAVVACVLAMVCKRAQQLPTLLAYVGSCCVRVGNGVQTDATTANIVGVCWQLLRACWQWCANGRNNCQHCWRMLAVVACVLAMVCKRAQQLPTLLAYVGSCCVRVGNDVQTGATTANIVGVCWQLLRACWQWCANGCDNCQRCWRVLAVVACVLAMVCKRMRQLPTLLAYVGSCCVRVGNGVQTGATTGNIVGVCWQLLRACWQWCANGRNNCQHCWRMLAVVACVLAMVCKRMRQLPTLLACVGSCCVRVGNGVQTGATTANIVGVCWQLLRACWQWCANGRNNCQHCWRMLAVVACVLAMVCKRMQQLPTSLGSVHRGKNTTHKSL